MLACTWGQGLVDSLEALPLLASASSGTHTAQRGQRVQNGRCQGCYGPGTHRRRHPWAGPGSAAAGPDPAPAAPALPGTSGNWRPVAQPGRSRAALQVPPRAQATLSPASPPQPAGHLHGGETRGEGWDPGAQALSLTCYRAPSCACFHPPGTGAPGWGVSRTPGLCVCARVRVCACVGSAVILG